MQEIHRERRSELQSAAAGIGRGYAELADDEYLTLVARMVFSPDAEEAFDAVDAIRAARTGHRPLGSPAWALGLYVVAVATQDSVECGEASLHELWPSLGEIAAEQGSAAIVPTTALSRKAWMYGLGAVRKNALSRAIFADAVADLVALASPVSLAVAAK